MAPLEDRSQITISTIGAEGVSYEYIRDYTERINDVVDSIIPDAEAVTARVSSGSGNVQITLKDIRERDYSQMDVAAKLTRALKSDTEARAFLRQQSSFGGRRASMPVQYVLQATNLEKLQEVLPKFMERVYENDVFQMADVDLKFSKPEARISINRDKAGAMGVSTKNIAQTLQYGLSGQRMGYFYMNGKQYEILGEINRQQRNKPAYLVGLYIRNDAGDMIQLDNLVELVYGTAPPKLYRYNRFVSATVSAGLAEGKTIGQGLEEMDKIADEVLDETFRTALAGDSKDYSESASSLMFAFILAIFLIYLILAAQFESFVQPLIVLLEIPIDVAFALLLLWICGHTLNLMSAIGLIVTCGIIINDSILKLDAINELRKEGVPLMEAIHEAGRRRLRPIIMTSLTTIFGMVPLLFTFDMGSELQKPLSIAMISAMLIGTAVSLFVIPLIYWFIYRKHEVGNLNVEN